jgi:hypothetical protein
MSDNSYKIHFFIFSLVVDSEQILAVFGGLVAA